MTCLYYSKQSYFIQCTITQVYTEKMLFTCPNLSDFLIKILQPVINARVRIIVMTECHLVVKSRKTVYGSGSD